MMAWRICTALELLTFEGLISSIYVGCESRSLGVMGLCLSYFSFFLSSFWKGEFLLFALFFPFFLSLYDLQCTNFCNDS